ncbi:hypothetical protein [Streptomyces sp. NPDC058155]|uniref:hypothetical protein n=1 Tax=Streptomyces sp. NPDC058155 TaxID=3346359 RepID=UPI0036ECA930
MEPVVLITSALAAGAGAAAQDVASAAALDAYSSLRDSVRRLFTGRRDAEEALEQHESDPETWQDALAAALTDAGAAEDDHALAAARDLFQLLGRDPDAASERPMVDLRNAKGVMVGDRNVQNNTFS